MFLFLLGISLLSETAYSQGNCDFKSINEFYNKLNASNPIQEQIKKRISEAESSIEIAKQRPNPVIDTEYLKGNQFGIDINNIQVTAQHIYEFGSKRNKRIEEAQLSASIEKRLLNLKGVETTVGYALKYQRVAQLTIVIDAVKEAISTFEKVIGKLSSRTGLTPEERVSLLTLRLASSDYKAKLNDLENEKTLLGGELTFITGCETFNPQYSSLPYGQLLPPLKNLSSAESGLVSVENLKIKQSEADLAVQKSLGYSNIAIGPVVEYQTQGNDKFLSAGVAVTFDLPLFHTNDAGKLNAARRMAAQKIESTNSIRNLNLKKAMLIRKYERSVQVLSQMTTLERLNKQHAEIERLFARGIVSIPMTIESHRQHIDFLESRFETENDLLVSLEEIVFIRGETQLLEDLFNITTKNQGSK
jgi:hypothetical protein